MDPNTMTINNVARKNGNLNLLSKKEKDQILYFLRKINEDISELDLIFAELELTNDQLNRLKQIVINNKTRTRNIIWTLTGTHIPIDEEYHSKKD